MKTGIMMGGLLVGQLILFVGDILFFSLKGFSVKFLIFTICFKILILWLDIRVSNGLKLTDKNLVVYNFYRGDIYSIDYCDINFIKIFSIRGTDIKIYTNYGQTKRYTLPIKCSRDEVVDYLRKNGIEVKEVGW